MVSEEHMAAVERRFDPALIRAFVRESNRIEGITRAPSKIEIAAHLHILDLDSIRQTSLEHFVAHVAPGRPIRDRIGMNVKVGHHRPPGGGRYILEELYHILDAANRGRDPYGLHRRYENLHPFMDGNGRSGRVLWLWQMVNQDHGDPSALQRGFLHSWYYQSLSQSGAA